MYGTFGAPHGRPHVAALYFPHPRTTNLQNLFIFAKQRLFILGQAGGNVAQKPSLRCGFSWPHSPSLVRSYVANV